MSDLYSQIIINGAVSSSTSDAQTSSATYLIPTGSQTSGSIVTSSSSSTVVAAAPVEQIEIDVIQYSRIENAADSYYESVAASTTMSQSYYGTSVVDSTFNSEVEKRILASTVPININENEEITVLGNRGIWANKAEVINWKGVIPIEQYAINDDANPEVINKRVQHQLEYIQELAIRYLRPPTPPTPGDIVIVEEASKITVPAPPLVIRQVPPRPATPEPLVVREAPPQPPSQSGRKIITISGKRLPPPPRKVVIERLAPLPSKPQSVIIERWLPYIQAKRRVVYQKSNIPDPVVVKPRNVIIQWEAPQVVIKKDIKYLGVVRANPADYVARFGTSLKYSRDLPQFVLDIKAPEGLVLAADYKHGVHELEGEVSALKLVDIEKEGLGEYRSYLERVGVLSTSTSYVQSQYEIRTTSYHSENIYN